MTYIIKTPQPITEEHRARLKASGSNLQFMKLQPQYLTHFKILYPNCAEILQKEYNLKKEDLIYVFYMKVIDLPHYKNYRSKFKLWHLGTVQEFHEKIRKHFEDNVWPQYRKRIQLQKMGSKRNVITQRMEKRLKFDIKTKWYIYFKKIYEEDTTTLNLKLKEFMDERFPDILYKFRYFCNVELKRKPRLNEYRLFLRYKAYSHLYPPKSAGVRGGD